MESQELNTVEGARKKVVAELSEGSANLPAGFSSIEDSLASLKNPGDTVSGKMSDGVGEWKVTRGATEADLTIQSGGDYE